MTSGGRTEKYRLLARIGYGGMGEVWRAEQLGAEGFRRQVAVKRILGELSADDTFREMFVREAKIAAGLQHANVVSVFDFDHDETGALFLIMELVDGVDLRRMTRSVPFLVPDAVFVVSQILRALDYAHSLDRPIVHRDVTPHNVLISQNGAVKLSDFGLARAEASLGSGLGRIVGKAGYLAPEQIQGEPLDARADLFSVGVILYELLTGVLPFGKGLPKEILARVLTWEPEPPDLFDPEVTPALAATSMRLLAKDRAERFHSAADVLRALGPVPDRTLLLGGLVQSCLTEARPSKQRRLFEQVTRSVGSASG